jgi:hypothetical protein
MPECNGFSHADELAAARQIADMVSVHVLPAVYESPFTNLTEYVHRDC